MSQQLYCEKSKEKIRWGFPNFRKEILRLYKFHKTLIGFAINTFLLAEWIFPFEPSLWTSYTTGTDKCANEGSKLPQESVSHSFNTAKAVIRRHLKDPPIEHPLANKVYANGPDRRKPMDKELNREQQVTISRLRSGHHTQLKYWRKKTDLTSDDKCRLCGTAPETIQHIMEECPGMNDSRPPSWDVAALAKSPLEALCFYERWSKRAGDA